MQQALRNRLTYGPIMLATLALVLYVDYAAEHFWTAGFVRIDDFHSHGLKGVGILALLIFILPLASYEVARLFTAESVRPYSAISILGSGALAVHAFLTQFPRFQVISTSALAFIVVMVMLFAALRRALTKQTHEAIQHMAGTVLSVLYLGGLSWFLMALRVKESHKPGGIHGTTWVLVMILLVVKFTDIGAFFGGKAIGRHKLIPWLSPGKTWEGLVCGVITASLVGAACAPWINYPDYPLVWWKGLIFGAVIGAIGQLGDLLESLMKRDADVKDSGSLVPGFGGVLDVIDSPLLAAPFAYLMFSLF